MIAPLENPLGGPNISCCASCLSVTAEMHQLAESLGKAIDAKDHYTRQHSEEVAVVGQMLTLCMGLPSNLADRIHIAGHLHDIGKIGLSDRVLQKPGPLSKEEWEEVKRHPILGAEIVAPVNYMRRNGIVDMVRHHHESWDGRGYPDGLAGKAIPLGARIIAVVDSLSAMLQDRPYRKGMTFAEARKSIEELSGLRYDPRVVRAFTENAGMIAGIFQSLNEETRAAPSKIAEEAVPAVGLEGF